MKTASFLALAAVGKLAAAHATFQEILVNGESQGAKGVRGTSNQNNPIYSKADELASDMMICKGGAPVDDWVEVASGDVVGLQWHHNNPSSGSGDPDEPIAESHKGPIFVWIAKAETEGKGPAWVKIQEEGYSGGKWAVDNFRADAGVIEFEVPDLEAGDYLVRSEIIALHDGDKANGAQLYNGCGQFTVTSSGSKAITDGVDITTVYKPDDAALNFNIWVPYDSYTLPGPAVDAGLGGGSGGAPAPAPSAPAASSSAAVPPPAATPTIAPNVPAPSAPPANQPAPAPAVPSTTLSTAVKPAPTSGSGSGSGSVARWGQCGGQNYQGPTACADGATCKVQNPYYSQCL